MQDSINVVLLAKCAQYVFSFIFVTMFAAHFQQTECFVLIKAKMRAKTDKILLTQNNTQSQNGNKEDWKLENSRESARDVEEMEDDVKSGLGKIILFYS